MTKKIVKRIALKAPKKATTNAVASEQRRYRRRFDARDAQGQLITEIFDKYPNLNVISELTGYSFYLLSFWRTAGKVPLGRVGHLSRMLDVSIYALNYVGAVNLLGKGPSWEAVIKECKLESHKAELILSKEAPPSIEEILNLSED